MWATNHWLLIPNPQFHYFFTYSLHNNNNNCRWFMKINRKDAEKLIMNPVNPFGTFLVRTSETAEGGFVWILLSCWEWARGKFLFLPFHFLPNPDSYSLSWRSPNVMFSFGRVPFQIFHAQNDSKHPPRLMYGSYWNISDSLPMMMVVVVCTMVHKFMIS